MNIAINGFGRIGRQAFKLLVDKYAHEVNIVGVNDLTSPEVLAYLLKYDTVYGIWEHQVSSDEEHLIVNDKPVKVYKEKDPALLPWGDLKVDVVIESTGLFTKEELMRKHLDAGARKVVLSAPAKGGDVPTFVLGVNGDNYAGQPLINNASCTTNCISPVAEVMTRVFGVEKAMMTTIHSYTATQALQDGPRGKDKRGMRAAAENIVPATTGAAIATTQVLPELVGLFDGLSIRVPTPVVSLADFTFLLKRDTTVEEVNQALIDAASEERYKGIFAVTNEPLVSSDFIANPYSSTADLSLTKVIDGDFVKVIAWYDNEMGYSNRLVEMVIKVGGQ
jgi:glyceraldehyde 3-phosphate dehydrogenase